MVQGSSHTKGKIKRIVWVTRALLGVLRSKASALGVANVLLALLVLSVLQSTQEHNKNLLMKPPSFSVQHCHCTSFGSATCQWHTLTILYEGNMECLTWEFLAEHAPQAVVHFPLRGSFTGGPTTIQMWIS